MRIKIGIGPGEEKSGGQFGRVSYDELLDVLGDFVLGFQLVWEDVELVSLQAELVGKSVILLQEEAKGFLVGAERTWHLEVAFQGDYFRGDRDLVKKSAFLFETFFALKVKHAEFSHSELRPDDALVYLEGVKAQDGEARLPRRRVSNISNIIMLFLLHHQAQNCAVLP